MAKVTEYPRITKMKDNDILLVDGPDGTRTILKNNAAKDLGGDIIAVTKSGSKDNVTLNLTDSPVDLATVKDLDDVANELLPIGTASGKPAIVTDAKLGTTFKRLKVAIEPVQAGSGDPAPDNVRPISGWDTVKVTRCGKNIFDQSRIVTQTGWFSIYIDVQEGHMVTASTDLPTGTGLLSYFMITAQGGEEALYDSHPVTKPSDPNLHLALRRASGDNVFSNYHYQVEIGSAATEYEPYVGNVSEVELPSEAGTVYGGELDLTAGTLTVDRANIASYNGESLPGKWISSMDVYSAGATPTTGAQVVYELSNPVVYNLTPVQVEALEGYNAVFADCGPVDLAYVKDVKIEEMIAEESDSTAPRAFTAGEYVIVKDKFYKVTADVSAGSELVPGTNVEETTVGDELNEIGEDVSEIEADVGEIGEDVGELKTQLVGEIGTEYSYKVADADAAGWKLRDNGTSVADANYKLLKYLVSAGTNVIVFCGNNNVQLQFQTVSTVPANAPNQYLIGNPIVGSFNGSLEVPKGAAYLIISTVSADNITGVYRDYEAINNIILHNVDSQIKNYTEKEKYYIDDALEVGGLDETRNGGIKTADNRLRSKEYLYSLSSDIIFNVPNGLQWFLLEFDNSLEYKKNSSSWSTGNHYKLTYPFFKVVLRKTSDANISSDDAKDFTIMSVYLDSILRTDTGNNYKLKDDGNCVQDTNYELAKYAVTKGEKYWIKSNHIYQFQKAGDVPTSGNTSVIGNPVSGQINEPVVVPENAICLIISKEKTDNESGLYYYEKTEYANNFTNSLSPTLASALYIGHRGGGKNAPENTIPSISLGHQNGFNMVELDVQFTSDKVPVILHDTTINRTGRNADGTEIASTINISNITYAESQDYDFGIYKGSSYAGTKLPTLEDVIYWCKRHGCAIELDISGTENMNAEKATIIYDCIKNNLMCGNVMITANPPELGLFAEYKDVCVCRSNIDSSLLTVKLASHFLQNTMFTMCSAQYPYATKERVENAHKYGMLVKGFTASTATAVDALWGIGVDKIILDGMYPNEIT